MTLQQLADYAMEYLDSKGVAADYAIKRRGSKLPFDHPAFKDKIMRNCTVVVYANERKLTISRAWCKEYAKAMIDRHLTPLN